MVFLAVLAIPLSSAHAFSLTDGQLASWIFALYAGPGLLGLVLALRYHQPLVLTGNVFAIILFASEGSRLAFPELAGAAVIAGAAVAILGLVGLSGRLARVIPAPIVLGLWRAPFCHSSSGPSRTSNRTRSWSAARSSAT